MSDQNEKRLTWLAFVYDSAIKHGVFRPADVVVHATPEVLAQHLPKELIIRLFEVAFDAGKLTPEGVLGVAPPSTLVKHIAPSTLWDVVRDAAARHGIAGGGNLPKVGKTPIRNWIAEVIAGGLEREIYSPADVTRHIPPGEWVKDVPIEVVAKMIASGLTRPQFDPRLALEHLTPTVIGEFVAPNLSWAVIDEGAIRAFELTAAKPSTARPVLKPPASPGFTPSTSMASATPPPPPTPVQAATVEHVSPPAPPASPVVAQPAAAWDTNMAESVDSWVETDMVETVETAPGGNNT